MLKLIDSDLVPAGRKNQQMSMTMAAQGIGGRRESSIQSLARQGSIYTLTLNEVQSHLGEPLHSMNLDELLRSIFPGEENPPLTDDAGGSSGTLTKKTVDEVWRDIQQGQKGNGESVGGCRRRPTLGEMTLEDFLSMAGVAKGAAGKTRGHQIGDVRFVPRPDWLQQYHQNQQQQAQQSIVGAYASQQVYQEEEGDNSSPSDPQTPRRKRGPLEDVAEKMVERRQKRMIKNRESAARSRARKQAYTHELENKVQRLEEENQRLRQQRELEAMIHYIPQTEPKQQLRRTSSAPL